MSRLSAKLTYEENVRLNKAFYVCMILTLAVVAGAFVPGVSDWLFLVLVVADAVALAVWAFMIYSASKAVKSREKIEFTDDPNDTGGYDGRVQE